jgi:hypothetical protein
MTQDHNNIYSIVERLRVLEEGLDKNQRSVNQLGATFKPKTVAVLTAKTDPKNPLAGKLVGGSESVEDDRKPVEEAVANEDILEKVKNSFKDFIKTVQDEIIDTDIKEKKREDTDIKEKKRQDRDLIAKAAPVAEDPTEQEPALADQNPVQPQINPTYAESAPVKTITITDNMICEIHGNELNGFEIRRGERAMPSRFNSLAEAEMALELFAHRLRKKDESQDYMEEK